MDHKYSGKIINFCHIRVSDTTESCPKLQSGDLMPKNIVSNKVENKSKMP